MNHAHLTSLLALVANLHIAHWKADTYGNTHRVLGDLYSGLDDLTDQLAECAMGKDGSIDFPRNEAVQFNFTDNAADLLAEAAEIFSEIRAELSTPNDDDLLNIVAEMSAAINKAKYLLKV